MYCTPPSWSPKFDFCSPKYDSRKENWGGGTGTFLSRTPYGCIASPSRRVASQMMACVAYLHAAGVAHRDVKAANFLLREDDDCCSIVLSDMGLGLRAGR